MGKKIVQKIESKEINPDNDSVMIKLIQSYGLRRGKKNTRKNNIDNTPSPNKNLKVSVPEGSSSTPKKGGCCG